MPRPFEFIFYRKTEELCGKHENKEIGAPVTLMFHESRPLQTFAQDFEANIMVQPRIAATAIKTPFDSHGPGVASRAYARLLELIDVSYRPGSPGALSAFALRL